MSVGAPALALAGAGMNVLGGMQETRANMSASAYQAAVAARNADLADANAAEEMRASQSEGQDWGMDAGQAIADRIAQFSASGTIAGAGSNAAAIAAARGLAARDQLRIRQEGTARMRSRQQESADFEAEAIQARRRQRSALWAGVLNTGTSLIGGAQSYRGVI